MTAGRWRVELMPSARRDLDRLPESVAAAVLEMIARLAVEPRRMGKPLRWELEGLWSARRGTYRVIYRLREDDALVQVITIDHRADVYGRGRRR